MDFQSYLPILTPFWEFLKTWWWVFPPFLLYRYFIFFWLFWRQAGYDLKEPRILLELKMPQTAEKPLKAMENVFAGFWQIYDPANPREKWLEGQYQMSFGIEIVSTEGKVHFYLRIPQSQRRLMETAVYSQYPDAELQLADDYTKAVPQNIPNKDWRMWGATYKLDKSDVYPLKTYSKFFEQNPDIEEEKKADPMAILIEGLSKFGEGEHLWLQFLCEPFAPKDRDFIQRGRKLVDELVKRPKPVKPPTVWQDVAAVGSTLATGEERSALQVSQPQEFIPPEMKLTPGEREIVAAIEEKISKPAFDIVLRFIYLAKTDKYLSAAKALPMSYFHQFSSASLNFLRPLQTVKVHTISLFFLDKRRGYVRRRRLFRLYVLRVPPYYPNPGGVFRLNIEEMATLFHFPSRITFPSVIAPRVEVKKKEAPPGLPVE